MVSTPTCSLMVITFAYYMAGLCGGDSCPLSGDDLHQQWLQAHLHGASCAKPWGLLSAPIFRKLAYLENGFVEHKKSRSWAQGRVCLGSSTSGDPDQILSNTVAKNGSLCPYYWANNTDTSRYPETILEARCTNCRCKSATSAGLRQEYLPASLFKCMKIKHPFPVLYLRNKTSCLYENGLTEISVGCSCAAVKSR